jgi:hypothetical protein
MVGYFYRFGVIVAMHLKKETKEIQERMIFSIPQKCGTHTP